MDWFNSIHQFHKDDDNRTLVSVETNPLVVPKLPFVNIYQCCCMRNKDVFYDRFREDVIGLKGYIQNVREKTNELTYTILVSLPCDQRKQYKTYNNPYKTCVTYLVHYAQHWKNERDDDVIQKIREVSEKIRETYEYVNAIMSYVREYMSCWLFQWMNQTNEFLLQTNRIDEVNQGITVEETIYATIKMILEFVSTFCSDEQCKEDFEPGKVVCNAKEYIHTINELDVHVNPHNREMMFVDSEFFDCLKELHLRSKARDWYGGLLPEPNKMFEEGFLRWNENEWNEFRELNEKSYLARIKANKKELEHYFHPQQPPPMPKLPRRHAVVDSESVCLCPYGKCTCPKKRVHVTKDDLNCV
jgi:hypothetical protein